MRPWATRAYRGTLTPLPWLGSVVSGWSSCIYIHIYIHTYKHTYTYITYVCVCVYTKTHTDCVQMSWHDFFFDSLQMSWHEVSARIWEMQKDGEKNMDVSTHKHTRTFCPSKTCPLSHSLSLWYRPSSESNSHCFECMRPEATSVWGLKLVVYSALSY
jgi:hypothetical protein